MWQLFIAMQSIVGYFAENILLLDLAGIQVQYKRNGEVIKAARRGHTERKLKGRNELKHFA